MSIEKPSTTRNTVWIDSDYNVRIKDDVINVDTTGGAVTLYLPNIKNSGFLNYPKTFCINDVGGAAGTNPITIIGVNGDLVNGGVSTVIQKDMGSGFADVCNTNEWLVSKDTDSATSGIGGGGMTNYIPKFTSTTTIGNSTMYQADTGVSIGTTTPDASALFQLDSTEQGFLPPRMTEAERDAITPAVGLTLYNTDTNCVEFWNGSAWTCPVNTTLYDGNSTVGSNRVATLTDRLTFTGGTTVHTQTSGSNTITAGTGTNSIGFGTFGNMSLLNMGSTFDHFDGNFAFGSYPIWQSQIYNNTTFVENAQAYSAVANYGGTDRPYAGIAYTAPDTSLKGFEVDFFGERILSQAFGLNRLSALGAANGIAFLSGSGGTGYIGVADQDGLISWFDNGTTGGWGGIYNSDGSITGNRTVTGDENLILFTNTNFRAITGDAAKIEVSSDNVILEGASITNNGQTTINGRLDLATAGLGSQTLRFKDFGITPFNGDLINTDLTANRTWTLPNASGVVMVAPAYNALVFNPTATEDGYVIKWNDTAGEYQLAVDSAATPPLTDVLAVGNTTADGQVIAALNGNGELDLRNGANNVVSLTNDNGAFTQDGVYITEAYSALYSDGYTAVHEVGSAGDGVQYFSSYAGAVGIVGTNDTGTVSTKTGIMIGIVNGGSIGGGAAGDSAEIGVIVGGNGGTIAAGALNSVKLGGQAFTMTDAHTAGMEQIALHNSTGSVRTLLGGTQTVNRSQVFQDADGVIALTSDIPSVAITDDVIPRGTGTGIEDGTWQMVGNNLFPTTTGSNIGQAANRIGTIFMSSTIDYSTNLLFNSGGTTYFDFGTDGRLVSNQFSSTITNATPVWQINANITERSGGDGYSVYKFDSTSTVTLSSNHFRTIHATAPTGGVNPGFGRYAVYGSAILSGGDNNGVGIYGLGNGSSTSQYGVYGHITGTPATARNRGVFGFIQTSNSGAASAGSTHGGYFQGTRQWNLHTGTYRGVEGFVNSAGNATGIGLNIGVEGSALNGATNYAFRSQANRGRVVFGTAAATANTFLTVVGESNDSSTNVATFNRLNGQPVVRMRADGLSQFNTTLFQLSGVGGAYQVRNMITDWTSTSSGAELEWGVGHRTIFAPTSDGTVRGGALRATAVHSSAFEVSEMSGALLEAQNVNAANFDASTISGIYGVQINARNQWTGASVSTIRNIWGVKTTPTNQSGAGNSAVVTDMGGLWVAFDGNTNLTATNQYGIRVGGHSNNTGASVTNFYGLYISSTALTPTNYYGVFQAEPDARNWFNGNVSVGSLISNLTMLQVRANSTANRLLVAQDNSGIQRFLVGTDGQLSIGNNTPAANPTSQIANRISTNAGGYFYGTSMVGTDLFNATLLVQPTGNTRWGIYLESGANTNAGETVQVYSLNNSQVGQRHIGVIGEARKGTLASIGIRGWTRLHSFNGTVVPTQYTAAVEAINDLDVDATESYGLRSVATWANNATTFNNDMIAVFGYAQGINGDAASTGAIIGGKFQVRNTTGASPDLMAINVPGSVNEGTIVLGADAPSAANSFVEIHNGNLEIIGANTGLILEDRTLGTRYEVYMDNGSLVSNALP